MALLTPLIAPSRLGRTSHRNRGELTRFPSLSVIGAFYFECVEPLRRNSRAGRLTPRPAPSRLGPLLGFQLATNGLSHEVASHESSVADSLPPPPARFGSAGSAERSP